MIFIMIVLIGDGNRCIACRENGSYDMKTPFLFTFKVQI